MSLGPERLTNPDFESGLSGWTNAFASPNTASVVGEQLVVHRESGAGGYIAQTGIFVAGHAYRIVVNIASITTGRITVQSYADGVGILATPGVHVIDVPVASFTAFTLSCIIGTDAVIEAVSVKEMTMALSSLGYELNVTLVDAGGDQANLRYKMEAADWTSLGTDVTTLLGHLNAVTRAVVKGYFVGERFVEDALTLPSTGVNIEERATVICQLAGDPTKKVTINIPAPEDTLFVGGPGTGEGYNIIDTTDSALSLYIATWEETGAIANISDGEYVADGGILYGKRTHRQSSNG